MREAGGLMYPVCNRSVWEVKLLCRDSADDAFYPWWGLDVLSNERRLTGVGIIGVAMIAG